ncbi:MAG: two component transcriptional regulator, LuxR family [Segetibacter sp.]|nr:two component transcriptional regulator, LuxR family [Segetibacter sp.]
MAGNLVGIYLSNNVFSTDLAQYIEAFSVHYQPVRINLLDDYPPCDSLSYLITDSYTLRDDYQPINKFRMLNPDFKLAMLFKELNSTEIPVLIQSGVDLFLSYQDKFQEILTSLQQAEHTSCYISPILTAKFVDYIRGGVLQHELEAILSKRELEMLYQIIKGETAKEAAAHLSVSVHTINFHLKKIYHKLGIKNKAQLISRFKEQLFVR